MSKRARVAAKSAAPKKAKVRDVFVAVPFAGLTDEPEWIALRELVPAATAPLKLNADLTEKYGDRDITLATILPMAWPAMVKADGRILLGLQRHVQSGDPNRDLAVALLNALETSPGQSVAVPALPGQGERLGDLLVDGPLDITMHETFGFWLDEGQDDDPGVAASLESANQAIAPTTKMAAVKAAYWTRMGEKSHIRWVLPYAESEALDALATLGAAGELVLGEQTRFAGMFRAHGRLVPVWDLPVDSEAADWEDALAAFATRFEAALGKELTPEARKAKQGLIGRQLTLR
ncbi:MAG: topoisomerase II [Hamadaea sp.]|nr:topoisomerase II [Hamadaea sp.]NUR47513.1 topoisomerase II [Hamadaea sp.]NUT06041.1 topoisomerase II [Hamadaea sp.]